MEATRVGVAGRRTDHNGMGEQIRRVRAWWWSTCECAVRQVQNERDAALADAWLGGSDVDRRGPQRAGERGIGGSPQTDGWRGPSVGASLSLRYGPSHTMHLRWERLRWQIRRARAQRQTPETRMMVTHLRWEQRRWNFLEASSDGGLPMRERRQIPEARAAAMAPLCERRPYFYATLYTYLCQCQ
jgi:hypothetical protein